MNSMPAKAMKGPDKPRDPFLNPFSLKKAFGNRYRVQMEESWQHERPEVRNPDRRWYEIIPCRGFKPGPSQEGPFIGLYSEDPPTLELYTDRPINAKSIWKKIRKDPRCSADFGMDGEVVIYFPAETGLLEIVAGMAGARKKRVLTEEQRARLVEAGKAGRDALQKWQEQRAQGQDLALNEAIPIQLGE